MRQCWRWFGPDDPVSVEDMLQAGVEGVVTALHHVPAGAPWTAEEIARRQGEVACRADGSPSGLAWEVVESLPVSEEIKLQAGDWRDHVAAYRGSLRRLAEAGIPVVCANFMPVLDWTRTDIAHRVHHGGTAMRFDLADLAAFDVHLLGRADAAADYARLVVEEAARRHAAMDEVARARLVRTVTMGLPGTDHALTIDGLHERLAAYRGVTPERLRRHLVDFLEAVVPVAEEVGVRLCWHPDDPPFPLLGLPRILSTEADYAAMLEAVPSPALGVTLCSGSLGARPDNDLPGMMERLGPRVHFLHLRSVAREGEGVPASFHEAEHLGGGTDMVALVAAVLREEARRRAEGRADAAIPMRPDHGQHILDDLRRETRLGYPAIGRLRGLAELRGVAAALDHPIHGAAR